MYNKTSLCITKQVYVLQVYVLQVYVLQVYVLQVYVLQVYKTSFLEFYKIKSRAIYINEDGQCIYAGRQLF